MRRRMEHGGYILVCDDEAHIRQIIAHKLRGSGYEVVEASDGQEALEAASARAPQLVITDFQMPRMSGVEMCKALKTTEGTSATPVLMLTARGYVLGEVDLAGTNICHVIGKPFGVRQLLDRVVQIVGKPRGAGDRGVAA